MRRALFALLTLCVAFWLLVAPAGARTETLACGAVVTHSVRLAADVQCPFGAPAGLIVGADRITIDLNGHQVQAAFGSGGGIGNGIENDGHAHVTIRSGSIGGFAVGVLLNAATDSRLLALAPLGLTNGIVIHGGGRNLVRNSSVFGRAVGIVVDGSDHSRLIGNAAGGLSGAISLQASYGVIAKNVMNDQPGDGVTVSGSFNRIAFNAIRSGFAGIEVMSGQANVVDRNWVFDVGGDGVLTEPQATSTVISRNLAMGNGADGIDVEGASTAILFNGANDNGGYGIEAVPGVFAVGNKASGNGNPMQCLNVTCG